MNNCTSQYFLIYLNFLLYSFFTWSLGYRDEHDYIGSKLLDGDEAADLTDEDDLKNKKLIKDFNIEGYPTIKMKKGNDIIDFDAKITPTSLEEFIQNVTQD